MNKIKVGDEVIVLAGRYKSVRGKVLKILNEARVLVEGVTAKKHIKPNPQANEAGGIKDIEVSIHRSNVSLYDSTANKASRVGVKTLEDGSRVRYFKASGEVVDV